MTTTASAAEWELMQGDIKKGGVSVLERNGFTFAALDQILANLGFAQSDAPGGLVVTFSGKKLEFWNGSNIARISGSVYTFPANVFSEGGHWWGESASSIKVVEQFLQSVARPGGLKWVKGDGTATSAPLLTPAAPPVATPQVSSPTTGVAISGVRWGQQADAYRAVVDISGETAVTVKELPGSLEVSFAGTSLASFGGSESPWSPLAVGAKASSGTALLIFAHNASRVKTFWLQSPSRYVIDFYFGSGANINTSTPSVSTTPTTSGEDIAAPAATPPAASGRFLVVVDAGHGGHDPGAVGNSLREKDINLKAALQLTERLKRLGLDVKLTRADDRYLKLAERTAFANNADADIFISLHCNALPKGKHASGMELYLMAEPSDKDAMNLAVFENRELSGQGQSGTEATEAADQKTRLLLKILGDMQQNDKISESTTLAENLYARSKALGFSIRKVRQAPFFVLRGAGMPAVLVEMGYITDPGEARQLNSAEYRQRMMDALAGGVLDYLKKSKGDG